MSGRIGRLAGALLLAGAVVGCDLDPGRLLSLVGIRNVQSVPAETAAIWLEEDRALLVQVRAEDERVRALPGAQRLALEDPIPTSLREARQPLLVLAGDPDLALGLAARLVRAGIPRVAVVSGDLSPLLETRTAGRPRSLAQPSRSSDHPIR